MPSTLGRMSVVNLSKVNIFQMTKKAGGPILPAARQLSGYQFRYTGYPFVLYSFEFRGLVRSIYWISLALGQNRL